MRKEIKVYQYHPVFYYFVGISTAPEDPFKSDKYILPADSTEIKPPIVQNGQIAIFDCVNKKWNICEDSFLHPKVINISFVARNNTAQKQRSIDERLISSFIQLVKHLYKNNEFYEVNPQMVLANISTTLNILNTKITNVYNTYNNIKFLKECSLSQHTEYHIDIEQIIYIIKKIIDEIIILFYITHNLSDVNKTYNIKYDDIGKVLGAEKCKNKNFKNLLSSISYDKFHCFFKIINELHNAYKHDILQISAMSIWSNTDLAIFAYRTKENNLNEIMYINVYLSQIITAFNDFLLDIAHIENFNGKHKLLSM